MIKTIAVSDVTLAANPAPLRLDGTRWVHRVLWRAYGIRPEAVLNGGAIPEAGSRGLPVATDLYRMAKALLAAAYDPCTGRLEYSGLAGSTLFAEYQYCTRRLQIFDPATLPSREVRLAFWINLYNALIIDSVITPVTIALGVDNCAGGLNCANAENDPSNQVVAGHAQQWATVINDINTFRVN